jgi:hypothetical protein
MLNIYRNLKFKDKQVFSLREHGGKVIGYTSEGTFKVVSLVVNQSGRKRVLKEKQKNVHAFIVAEPTSSIDTPKNKLSYCPYTADYFFDAATKQKIETCSLIKITKEGIFYA